MTQKNNPITCLTQNNVRGCGSWGFIGKRKGEEREAEVGDEGIPVTRVSRGEGRFDTLVGVLPFCSVGRTQNAILDGCSTVDSTLDYDGIGWYSMVLHGIRWYCMVFDGILLLNSIRWYSTVLHGLRWYCRLLHGI